MARKNYQVKAKDGACWQKIHHSLCCKTHYELNIPDRECLCKNDCKFDETIGTYQLSLAEVEELRKHPDVQYVELDVTFHAHEMGSNGGHIRDDLVCHSNRFGNSVKNYRDLHYVPNNSQLVQSSLMAITGQLNQGTTNWVLAKSAHPNTPAMNYWQSVGFPLLYDYAVYPSVPANPADDDPLKSATQIGTNLITISTTGPYQLFVAADGEYAAIEWTRDDGYKIYPDLGGQKYYSPGTNPVPGIPAGKENFYTGWNARTDGTKGTTKEISRSPLYGIHYQVINLGILKAGTHTLSYEVRNGGHGDPNKENWNNNPGGIAWQLYSMGGYTADYFTQQGITGDGKIFATDINYTIGDKSWDSTEWNRTGYQLLRCEESATTNPWASSSRTVKTEDVQYTNDGLDVDIVVMDNGFWLAHPEFCVGENDPPNYIGGNVLNRSGKCGVLDMILDAPAYLDPEYWITNPSLLETRWDGTKVPTETSARNWWSDPNSRSPSFDNFGSISIPEEYARAYCNGTKTAFPSQPQQGSHGTPCASQAYGKNFGWAFNSNKWCIDGWIALMELGFRVIQIFHKYKPNNPKFSGNSAKNPTVSSNSWGKVFNQIIDNSQNFSYEYRGTAYAEVDASKRDGVSIPQAASKVPNLPKFITQGGGPASMNYYTFSPAPPLVYTKLPALRGNSLLATEENAMKAALSEGVIMAFSAGNEGWYLTEPGDIDHNNKVVITSGNRAGDEYYIHRAPYPMGVKDDAGYDLFSIGAINSELKNRHTLTSDTFFKDKGTGTLNKYQNDNIETLSSTSSSKVCLGFDAKFAENTLANIEDKIDGEDYSNRGNHIDFYAPADGTLAATIDQTANTLLRNDGSLSGGSRLARYVRGEILFSNYRFTDGFFSGTSSACPVTAGLMACTLQQNRNWTCTQLKTYLKEQISPEISSTFYMGYAPGSDPDDLRWAGDYSTHETDVRIIREVSGSKTTPNPVYEASSGLAPSRPNLNERFSVTSGSAKVKIIGIREFTSSDSGNPVELRIANGYYLMQITTDTSYSYENPFSNSIATAVGNYKFKIKENSGEQVIQVSDDGGSSWTALEIATVNGNFVMGTQGAVYYYLDVDDSVGIPTVNNPTYNIQTNVSSVNEGGTLITTVTTTNVADGTTLYWSFSGANINSSDFSSGSLTGSGSISNNSFNFTHVLANDATTEGNETLEIKVFTDATRQLQVATKNVTISDTSATATYNITTSTTSVNEGSPITYTLTTTNVPNGTTLYSRLSGNGVTADDFSSGNLEQSPSIFDNTFSFYYTVAADLSTEGSESLNFQIFTDSARTNEVASNSSVTINDTSQTPAGPSYALSVSPTTVNEGDTFTSTVTTTNVAQGTTLYWSAMGAGVSNNDFSSGSMVGSGTVGFDGSFQFSHTLAEDGVTEGIETIAVKLFTNSGYTQQVGSTVNVTVNDTSQAKTYAISSSSTTLSEGGSFTITVATTNVLPGTTLYWKINEETGNINTSDFVGALDGSAAVNSQGIFSFSKNLANDLATEGEEKFTVKLYTDATFNLLVASTPQITINDTSLSPQVWNLSCSPTSVNEGNTFTTTVTTSNVPNTSTFYYELSGSNITADDFETGGSNPSLAGSAVIQNNTAQFTHTVKSDSATEGTETVAVKIFANPGRTVQLGSTVNVTIGDTSQTPATPSYALTPDKTAYNEGETMSTIVTTSNVALGTNLYFGLEATSGTLTQSDVSSLFGSGTVAAGGGSTGFAFAINILEDTTTEGVDKFVIKLYDQAYPFTGAALLAISSEITINDTSIAPASPTYTLSANTNPIDEGEFLSISVVTTNVTANTTLYWEFSGTNIGSADFDNGILEGDVVIPASGSQSFGTTIKADTLTEGNETLAVKLYSDSGRTTQVGNTLSVTINDTSINPAVPSYNITSSVTQLNEGNTLTTTVTTQNVTEGTTLYWVVDQHTGSINAGDFSTGSMSGTGTVNNSTFTITHVIANDVLTEGEEKFAIKLYTDSGYTNNVANTSVITIFDTSTTANPTYSLSTTESNFKEGDSFTTTVTTTNVIDATTLYWKLEGIDANDLSSGSIQGSGIITSNTFTFSHTLANDLADEGDESLQIKLFTDIARNNQVGNTLAVTIKDTSQVGFNVIVTAPNNNEYILVGNDTDGTI